MSIRKVLVPCLIWCLVSRSGKSWTIPQILHQTWKTDQIPKKYRASARREPPTGLGFVDSGNNNDDQVIPFTAEVARWRDELLAAIAPALAFWVLGRCPKRWFDVGASEMNYDVFFAGHIKCTLEFDNFDIWAKDVFPQHAPAFEEIFGKNSTSQAHNLYVLTLHGPMTGYTARPQCFCL